MKGTILTITAVTLVMLVISSSCLITNTKSTHNALEISDGNQQVMNVEEATENCGKPQECKEECPTRERNCNTNEAEPAENTQDQNLNESTEIPIRTSENETPQTDICPPDGRVYYTNLESSYAFTPTYSPKKPSPPIVPLELEN